MTATDILIQPGIPEPLRARAGALFFEAFEGKLGGFLGRDGRGARLMAQLMQPKETLSALSPDKTTLYGLAGLKTARNSFMDGTFSDMAGEYGRFGGLWRGDAGGPVHIQMGLRADQRVMRPRERDEGGPGSVGLPACRPLSHIHGTARRSDGSLYRACHSWCAGRPLHKPPQ